MRFKLILSPVKTGITDRIVDTDSDRLPVKVNVVSLAATSRFSRELETTVVLSTNKSEIGEGEKRRVEDIFDLDLTARLLLMDGRLRARGGFRFRRNDSNQESASFSQFGIKGGLDYKLVENLRLVTMLETRSKKVEGLDEPLPYSLVTANLEYTF